MAPSEVIKIKKYKERVIASFMTKNKGKLKSVKQIAKKFNISRPMAYHYLSNLVKRGKLKRYRDANKIKFVSD